MVLNLAPDAMFLIPGNGTSVNGTAAMVENLAQRDAMRVAISTSMTVLIGLFQVVTLKQEISEDICMPVN